MAPFFMIHVQLGLYRFNLEAGKAAALGHTWSGATHAPGRREGGKRENKFGQLIDASFRPIFST